MQEYLAGRRVCHVDLYRLRVSEVLDFEPQILELAETGAIVAIEWADRLTHPLKDAIRIRIDDRGEEERIITVELPRPDNSE